MNQTMREVMATVAMAAVLGVGMTGYAGCKGNKTDSIVNPVATPTTAVEATQAPTKLTATVAPTPTEEAIPTLLPTERPVATPVPTKVPELTE
ncbi:MAG: hypothetical protein PUC73_07285, partial [Lachnospiraceae bacterium]|nr:hypothetical protein [Lachnospiraceae bacterium]